MKIGSNGKLCRSRDLIMLQFDALAKEEVGRGRQL